MSETVISTDNLTRHFKDVRAVQNLDLSVPKGTIYGFLGPNGAGKTTTIRMLLGLIRPTAGDLLLFNTSLHQQRPNLLRRVGALVESPSLYGHLTGRENLEITRRLRQVDARRIERVLETVDLAPAADRPVRTWSKGMKQRLGLALALIAEPELLILDEPTDGLDPSGMQEMRTLIVRLAREEGMTVFLSSHLLGEVERVADHLGIIREGSMVFQGTLDELHARSNMVLEVGVDDPARARELMQADKALAPEQTDNTLTVACDGHKEAAAINSRLVGAGLQVHHLALRRTSLEELFFDLTGKTDGEVH